MSIPCKSQHLFLVWYVLESQNIYACADRVFEQERKTQYLWKWHRSVVPDESSRDFGPCDRFRTRAVSRSLLSDTCYLSSSCHVAHKASTQPRQISAKSAKSFFRLSSSTGRIPQAFFLIMVEKVDCVDFAEIFSFFCSCSCSCFVFCSISFFHLPLSVCF